MSKHHETIDEWLERDVGAAIDRGEISPAYEIDELVARIGDVIAAGRHPIVCGEPGVGKSAILAELVRRARAGNGPAALAGNKRFLQLSFRKRLSALRRPDQLGEQMQALVAALLDSGGTIVPIFRDIHLAYDFDLEPQLALLGMRLGAPILGEGVRGQVEAMLEENRDLEQHFLSLPVDEPDLTTTTRILERWHQERVADDAGFDIRAVREAINLTNRFLSRARQPQKSIHLLSQVRSLVPPARAVRDEDVIERFHQTYRVPRFLIDPEAPFDVDATERSFRAQVLGQAQAVQTVVRMIAVVKAGLSDPRRPFGAYLFVGPTGVGKTHLAQLLAQYLFGSRERMVRFNMADYQHPGDALTLFGNPDGYNLRFRRGTLTMRLMGHPFAVLLLDEFEKAHENVHDRFLQLVDEGSFINGAAETVSCRSLIIIATSNAGAEIYSGRAIGFAGDPDPAEQSRELERRVRRTFRIEFLNRFDQVVHFRPLGRADIRTIAMREVSALAGRAGLEQRGYNLEVDEAVLDWLTAHGYDPLFGARFLRRTIERRVTTALAETLVRHKVPPGSSLALRVRGGQVVASVTELARAQDDQSAAQAVTLPAGSGDKTRKLDHATLVSEAEGLIARARLCRERLERDRGEASELLTTMNQPGFWDDAGEAREVLERYRELDVAIQSGGRYDEPIAWLEELLGAPGRRPGELARNLERAARSLRAWEERLAEDGPGAVWLLLRDIDPRATASDWLGELVGMETAWCRQLGLAAEIAACSLGADDQLCRVVLDVVGPGAASYLAMEDGLHRLVRSDGPDLRVRLHVVAKGAPPSGDEPPSLRRGVALEERGPLDMVVRSRTRLIQAERGVVVELLGSDTATLAHLTRDLEAAFGPGDEPPVARLYADGGVGARDPRTSATIPRYKDVMRGRLDPLLEAWRRLD